MKDERDPRGRRPVPDRDERVRAMEALRRAGWTWARVGARYGISRQAASQYVKRYRYGREK